MRVKVDILNKFIDKVSSGNTEIIKAQYFPKFEYDNGKFVQIESYQITYKGDKLTQDTLDKITKYFSVELIWEEDVIPIIPYVSDN